MHTTVSNDSDAVLSKKFGSDYPINYKSTPLAEYVKVYTGNRGFDFIFDTVGGSNLENSFQAAKLNGSVASIASGGTHDLTLQYTKGLSLHAVLMLIPLMTGIGRSHYGNILFEIKKLVESEAIKPFLHQKIFDWKQVALAHKLVESKEHKGKVVLTMGDKNPT